MVHYGEVVGGARVSKMMMMMMTTECTWTVAAVVGGGLGRKSSCRHIQ